MEDDDYSFDGMCRVCLTEEGDMISLLTASVKIQIDDFNNLMMLDDILSHVIHSEVFFINGPYLMCSNCATEAEAAYKFKKRSEEASTMLKDYGLSSCTKEHFAQHKSTSFCDSGIVNLRNNTNNCSDVTDSNFELGSIKSEESYEEVTVDEVEIDNIIKDENLVQQNYLDASKEEENSIHLIIGVSDEPSSSNNDGVQNIENGSAGKVCLKDSDKVLCAVCGFKKSRSAINRHMLKHAGQKNYVCPICHKRFSEKGNMKVHTRIHTGNFPYSCDVCGKRFNHATDVKIHKRIHDGVKPYKCHICTYCARTNSQLRVHINRHIGIKQYHCAQCEYSAYSKHALKRHIAKHYSNSKCHICKTCGKGFARTDQLKTHEQSHTGEKPHICELCGRGFTQAHSLRGHLRNIHKKID